MSESIDPAAVMVEHAAHETVDGQCVNSHYSDDEGTCEPYRLAEALVGEQAKTARVAEMAHRFELVPRARLLGALAAKAKP